MITLGLLVIGFLSSCSTLGSGIIGAFSLIQWVLWPVAIITTLISLLIIVLLIIGATGIAYDSGFSDKLSWITGISGGSFVGLLIGFSFTFISYAQLWLSYFIINNTLVAVTTFAMLPQNVVIAISTFLVIIIFKIFRVLTLKPSVKKEE